MRPSHSRQHGQMKRPFNANHILCVTNTGTQLTVGTYATYPVTSKLFLISPRVYCASVIPPPVFEVDVQLGTFQHKYPISVDLISKDSFTINQSQVRVSSNGWYSLSQSMLKKFFPCCISSSTMVRYTHHVPFHSTRRFGRCDHCLHSPGCSHGSHKQWSLHVYIATQTGASSRSI